MKKKPEKVQKVMKEYKEGTLHSGKGGPVVKSRKQAVRSEEHTSELQSH